jgi:hypothetical protein
VSLRVGATNNQRHPNAPRPQDKTRQGGRPGTAIMSRLFTKRSTHLLPPASHDPNSAFSSLLSPPSRSSSPSLPQASRPSSALPHTSQGAEVRRSWLSALESRRCSTGERPPPRKLIKEPNGSARPSSSVELSDGDRGGSAGEKGGFRRKLARLRQLYRRNSQGHLRQ